MEIALVLILVTAGIAAVMWPLLRRDASAPDPTTTPSGDAPAGDRTVAGEVARYREALRAGTVCRRCRQANPPGSRFCSNCGRQLRGRAGEARTAATA